MGGPFLAKSIFGYFLSLLTSKPKFD
jgi:hypothetical protein